VSDEKPNEEEKPPSESDSAESESPSPERPNLEDFDFIVYRDASGTLRKKRRTD
jgi:hypothetical protein